MAILEPCFAFELLKSLKYGFCTYSVCSVWVSKVTCKIDLMRLYLLEKLGDDVDVRLSPLSLLDAAGLVERKVEEMAVGLVVQSE